MPTTVKTGWLKDKNGDKFAPKTLTSQVQTSEGTLLEDKIRADLDATKAEIISDVSITPDWNSDEGEEGHVLNRTHYVDKYGKVHKLDNKYIDAEWLAIMVEQGEETEILPEREISFTSNFAMVFGEKYSLTEGKRYTVYWSGVAYECVAVTASSGDMCIGNANMYMTTMPNTGEPFCFTEANGSGWVYKKTSTAETITARIVKRPDLAPNKLPVEFLPDEVVKTSDVEWLATETIVESDVVVLPLQDVQVGSYSSLSGFQLTLTVGIVYEVHWNDESYVCEAFSFDGGVHLGNPALLDGCSLQATNEPFIISNFGGTGGFIGQGSGTSQIVSVKITGEPIVNCVKLPAKYLPNEALTTTGQILTTEQKAQARENIGAVSIEELVVNEDFINAINAMIDAKLG